MLSPATTAGEEGLPAPATDSINIQFTVDTSGTPISSSVLHTHTHTRDLMESHLVHAEKLLS